VWSSLESSHGMCMINEAWAWWVRADNKNEARDDLLLFGDSSCWHLRLFLSDVLFWGQFVFLLPRWLGESEVPSCERPLSAILAALQPLSRCLTRTKFEARSAWSGVIHEHQNTQSTADKMCMPDTLIHVRARDVHPRGKARYARMLWRRGDHHHWDY